MVRILATLALVFSAAGCSFLGGSGLTLDVEALELDGVSAAVVTLSNHGPVATDWDMLFDAPWLAASPASGTLDPWNSTRVAILVDRAYRLQETESRMELSPGTYAATVTAASDRGDDSLDVTFHVAEEPTVDACVSSTPTGSGPQSAATSPGYTRLHANRPDAPPTHVLIKARDGTGMEPTDTRRSDLRLDAVALAFGLTESRPGPGRAVRVARIPGGSDPETLVARLARDPRVEWAELDRPLHPQQVLPNDPSLPHQWAACRFGLPNAWGVWSGTAGIGTDAAVGTIAVIDSGVDLDHPDLSGRILPGYDFCPAVGTCSSTAPISGGGPGDPNNFHGTHVAGIAAAVGDNDVGVAGVAWGGVRILPVKVFDDSGRVTSISAVACGIYWSIGSTDEAEICGAKPNDNPARILNLSLGGTGTSSALDDAVAAATDRGALVFAASGNVQSIGTSLDAHKGILMPANAPSAIAVGAVNSNFERSWFSMFDIRGGETVDLMAPGGYLLSDGSSVLSTSSDDSYTLSSGTSMATPYAAGVAALLWSRDPSATPEEVYDRMRSTAYVAPGWTSFEYGSGVVCADAALGLSTRCGLPD